MKKHRQRFPFPLIWGFWDDGDDDDDGNGGYHLLSDHSLAGFR